MLNSFPYICGNSNKANEHYMKEKELNLEFIDKIIQSSSNLLIACGDKVKPDLYKEHFNIIKNIKSNYNINLYTYSQKLTKEQKRPRHLNLQAQSNKGFYDNALKYRVLYELKISNNSFEIGRPFKF